LALELLLLGVDVNHQNTRGETPLHYYCRSPNPFPQLLIALLNNGANPNVLNRRGNSPLHMLMDRQFPDLVEIMLRYEGNPKTACKTANDAHREENSSTCRKDQESDEEAHHKDKDRGENKDAKEKNQPTV